MTSAGKPRAFSSARTLAAGTNRAERLGLNAFDKDEFAFADGMANCAGGGVFRRIVAGQRVVHGRELDDDIAGAGLAFQHLGLAAARQELGVIAREGRLSGLDIFLVGLRIGDIHARDPISFRHYAALKSLRLMRHSAICTAFSAAPLRRLSDTIHRLRRCSTVGSLRMRLMKVASSPAHSMGVT